MRPALVGVLLLAACREAQAPAPPPPSLSVTVGVTLTARFRHNVYYGCDVLWRARASEDTTRLRYAIATGNDDRDGPPWPPIAGTFQDSVRVAFAIDTSGIIADPHRVSWELRRVRDDSVVSETSARIRQDLDRYPNCWLQ